MKPQPLTIDDTLVIREAIHAVIDNGRTVIAVQVNPIRALADGPWSTGGVDLIYNRLLPHDYFELVMVGIGAFTHDTTGHTFPA